MTDAERILHVLILDGPCTIDELTRSLRLPRRAVERGIQSLRLQGNPIGSDDRGVWVAHTRSQGIVAYRALRARALNQLQTAQAVKRAAMVLPDTDELTLGLVG